jgi:phage anti-repressor protein
MAIIAKETIISHLESTEEFPVSLSEVWEWLGYARKDNALKGFLRLEMAESIDFIQFRQEEEHSLKDSLEVRMTVDCFKLWAMSAQTAKGKEVRLYYIQIEKEWKVSQAKKSQISLDEFQSFKHEFEAFKPWGSN